MEIAGGRYRRAGAGNVIDPATGALREFFDAERHSAPRYQGRIVEPGHEFEWAWLLLRWAGAEHARAGRRPSN